MAILVAVEMSRRVNNGSTVKQKNRDSSFRKTATGFPAYRARRQNHRTRAAPQIVGTYFSHAQQRSVRAGGKYTPAEPFPGMLVGHVVPDARGMFAELDIKYEHLGGAHDQDKVAVELVDDEAAQKAGRKPTARIVKIFGRAGEADADIAAILENHQIKTVFPDEVMAEAAAIPEEIPAEELGAARVL